ncbi:uncharacterized protein LOC111046828 isoform X2 [Nilaparvata lugens]|uniref:uncharacterized protein LOC111046828 isoform X2 n=1 Tax=Nilaparvata lugens TaxID=108931 RepID=UPI00193E892D|nr:uncharacterized protein LOC111046828 isoform X2 [Nilaparvata lugens]
MCDERSWKPDETPRGVGGCVEDGGDSRAVHGSSLQRVALPQTSKCLHMAAGPSAEHPKQKERAIIYDSTVSLDVKSLLSQRGRCPAAHPHIKVEKIDGGIMVAGVMVVNSCQFVLPAFGCLFLIIGTLLTVTSYRGPEVGEKAQHYATRMEFSKNSRILGPICLGVALLMIVSGTVLCVLSKRARLKQDRVGYHCPLHGDFFPPEPAEDGFFRRSKTIRWWCGEPNDNNDDDFEYKLPPQCPQSMLSSQRGSISSNVACPAPLPFIGTYDSARGMSSVPTHIPSDLIFGSIRSLSVSHDIASFPASRSPSPISSTRIVSPSPVNLMEDVERGDVYSVLHSPMIESITPEIKMVAPAPQASTSHASTSHDSTSHDSTSHASTSHASTSNASTSHDSTPGPSGMRRKSVTIVLPTDIHH